MTQGEVSVKIEEGGEGEAVSNGDDSSPTEETNAYDKWPQAGIKEPTNNDVLYGRGGGTNHHQGNKRYCLLVEEKKVEYVNSKRLDKPVVALNIVKKWREQSPPGRFLKLDEKKGTWSDVGDKKAREKTSQALREKAPQIRQELEAGGGEVSGNWDLLLDQPCDLLSFSLSFRYSVQCPIYRCARILKSLFCRYPLYSIVLLRERIELSGRPLMCRRAEGSPRELFETTP